MILTIMPGVGNILPDKGIIYKLIKINKYQDYTLIKKINK